MGLLKTEWLVESSEETSESFILTAAEGKLYLSSEITKDKMIISYSSMSMGAGKGLPFGVAQSRTVDPMGGFDNIGVGHGNYFGSLSFPCRGYIITIGASAGIIGTIWGMNITGGGLTAVLFGQVPVFAGVRLWGTGNALAPSVGMSVGLAKFSLENYTKAVKS